jgi:hypothetical protein
MKRVGNHLGRKKVTILMVLMTLAVALGGQSAQANLLINGSFEDGSFVDLGGYMRLPIGSTDMTGWTVISTGTNDLAWITTPNPFGVSPYDGIKFLDLTGNDDISPFGGVQQTINLASGQYTLSFALGSSSGLGVPVEITATAGAKTQDFISTNTTSADAWEVFSMDFSASGLTSISLVGKTGLYYIGLDDVKVTATPLPPTTWLLGSGLLVLLRWRRPRKS